MDLAGSPRVTWDINQSFTLSADAAPPQARVALSWQTEHPSRPMFFLIRTCLVVGVIFYFSPVRQRLQEPTHLPGPVAQAEAAWRDLSAEARRALMEELRTSAATSHHEAAQRFGGSGGETAKRP
jgi:hypothetical protein